MKRNILLITFLTILGSLGQGKPVNKKKQKDKPPGRCMLPFSSIYTPLIGYMTRRFLLNLNPNAFNSLPEK